MVDKINEVSEFVRKDMEGKCSAHDFFHIQRVQKLANKIVGLESNGNLLIVNLGALLHEYFDEKFFETNLLAQREETLVQVLESLGISQEEVKHIVFIAKNVGYGKSLERGEDFPYTVEFKIVEDADRLEAIGAIAIARTFAYGGKKNRPIYDPTIKTRDLKNKEDYKQGSTSTLNHFYEKLLLLVNLMHTENGKKIAEKRHIFMESYLDQFHKERNCED